MIPGDRLLEIRRKYQLNQVEMGDFLGLSQGGYSNIESGRSDITKSIQLLLESKLNINIKWLMTGEGEMFLPKKVDPEKKYLDLNDTPLLEVSAWGGGLLGEQEPQYLTRLLHYNVPGFEKADFLIPVQGDSMVPQYYSGDIIAIRKIVQSEFIQWGRVHVLDTNQGIIIKILEEGEKEGSVKCISLNSRYKQFNINLSDCHGIYLVMGLVRLD